MKASLKKECMCDVIAFLETGLAMKMGNNWKTMSFQTSIALCEQHWIKIIKLKFVDWNAKSD